MSVVDLDELHLQVMGVAGEIEEQSTMLATKLDHIIHLLQLLTNEKPAKRPKVTERRGRRALSGHAAKHERTGKPND